MSIKANFEEVGRRLRLIAAVAACGAIIVLPASAGERGRSDATWIGPFDGLWSVADNWSGGVVPNGADWNVFIDSDGGTGSCAHVNGNYGVGGLAIDPGDMLRIDDNRAFYFADGTVVTNNGDLHLNSGGNYTYLWLTGANATLTGDGQVIMGDTYQNWIHASDWHYRLTNTGNHTIRGAGSIGGNNMLLTNESLIQGDSAASILYLELGGGDVDNQNFNTGTMQGTGGGTLSLWGSAVNNAGGVIQALDGSFVELGGSTHIYNGTLTTAGNGLIYTRFGHAAWLQDLSNQGMLSVRDNTRCYIRGTITNQGTMSLDSAGNYTYLWLDQPAATLTGSGEVVFNNNSFNHLCASDWHYRLTNTGGHTIRGGGDIGANNMLLTNESLVQADMPATVLYVDLAGDGGNENFNTGTMQATNGATLGIYGSAINNQGGVIQALDGACVQLLAGSHIYNGTLGSQGTGAITAMYGHNAYIENLTNTAHISAQDNSQLYYRGTIINDGSITLESAGNYTYLWLDQPEATLTGSGEVVLAGSQFNRLYASDWHYRLTNAGGHTIRGGGNLGGNNMLLTNDALIQADMPGASLTVDMQSSLPDYENFNTATMRAIDGATLWIWGTSLNNDGGLIEAMDGSFVGLGASAYIYNGTLATEGSGVNYVTSGHVATIENLTNSGHLAAADNTRLYIQGTITNDGTITLDSAGNYTYLWLTQPQGTLTGTGEVILGDNPYNHIYASDWQYVLTNGPEHTIRGGGNIGGNNMGIVNQGSLVADAAGGMTVDVSNSGFDNQGLIHVTGDGYLNITTGPFTTSGTVQIDATRTLYRYGNFTQSNGITTVEGTLQIASGAVDLQGGELSGNGLVNGNFSNLGTVAPGLSIGELTIQGEYTQPKLGVLHIEVAGTGDGEYDVLTVEGGATVNGTIVIEPTGGYEPMIGDEFTILTTTGSLNGVGICRPPYMFTFLDHAIVATVIDEPLPADLNCDGAVDIDDLFMVLGAWGPCPGPPHGCRADIDGSGNVDIDDLFAVLANWT